MSRTLTKEEKDSFRKYALDSMTESDGTQSQWADYTICLLDENERLRDRVAMLNTCIDTMREKINPLDKLIDVLAQFGGDTYE
jgi:hypothetical protein